MEKPFIQEAQVKQKKPQKNNTHALQYNFNFLKLQGNQVLHFIYSYKKNSTANYKL